MLNLNWRNPYWGCSIHHYGECPPRMFPTQYYLPTVSPTQNMVNTNVCPHVVPHIHPSHITTVNVKFILTSTAFRTLNLW
jgi:spore coat protein D